METWQPFLSASKPVRGGKSAQLDTEATIREEPRLVCRPRPRMESVKIVGKMQDSKERTKEGRTTPPLPFVPIAAAMKGLAEVSRVERPEPRMRRLPQKPPNERYTAEGQNMRAPTP